MSRRSPAATAPPVAPVEDAVPRDRANAEDLLEALAEGIARRVQGQRRAEEQLAAFVFREDEPGPATAEGAGAGAADTSWRHFVERTLGAAGDPPAVALLCDLAAGPRRLDELAGRGTSAGAADRLALADRIGALAQSGLVSRELSSDLVALTALGSALLRLLDELERRASTAASPAAGAATGNAP